MASNVDVAFVTAMQVFVDADQPWLVYDRKGL